MAKKKGGMVLIIGVGAKPKKEKKDSMKKSVRAPRRRGGGDASNRARTHSFKQKMRENPNHLDELLERLDIDKNLLERIVSNKHNLNLESALRGNVNIPEMLDEARKVNAANKGQFTESGDAKPKLKKVLKERGIPLSAFKASLEKNPSMDFQERLASLGGQTAGQKKRAFAIRRDIARGGTGDKDSRRSGRTVPEPPTEAEATGYNEPMRDFYIDRKGNRVDSSIDNPRRTYMSEKTGQPTVRDAYPPHDSDEEDDMLEFYTRLFSHKRDPLQAALNQLGRTGMGGSTGYGGLTDADLEEQQMQAGEGGGGPDTTPSSVFTQPNAPPGMRLPKPEDDDDPSIGFDAASIGATTPKTMTANPRVLNDPKSTRAGQGQERTVSQFLQTSFDDTNVMNPAWALLKGNPSMRDAEGRAINHPAAMVYDDLATQIHLNEIGPNDFIDDPDDETAADRMEQMRNPTHQKKLMRRLKQGKPTSFFDAKMATRNDQAEKNRLRQMREEAREQTRNTMEFGNEDDSPSPNYGIQQSTGTDVRMKPGNIMEQM